MFSFKFHYRYCDWYSGRYVKRPIRYGGFIGLSKGDRNRSEYYTVGAWSRFNDVGLESERSRVSFLWNLNKIVQNDSLYCFVFDQKFNNLLQVTRKKLHLNINLFTVLKCKVYCKAILKYLIFSLLSLRHVSDLNINIMLKN